MKTPEDEAFDELATRQGDWGSGFQIKPAHCQCFACKDGIIHASDCAVHNGPAYPVGECDCDVAQEPYDQTALELCNVCGWKTLIPDDGCLNCEREQPAQEPVAWLMVNKTTNETWSTASSPMVWNNAMWNKYPLYTAPPKREWEGLTEEDLRVVMEEESCSYIAGAKWAEEILKRKNT